MCILQIEELESKLSDEFKQNYPEIPSKNLKGMRNLFAHNYGNISTKITWKTISEDIPLLKSQCIDIVVKYQLLEQQIEDELYEEEYEI